MKSMSTFILKGVVFLIGLAFLSLYILALPRIIGSVEMGGYDPLLLGLYIPGIPFFIALFQILNVLNYIEKNKAFSELSIKALIKIRYCAIVISLLYIIGMPYIFYVADKDDAPGVVAIGLIIIIISSVIAVFITVLKNLLLKVLYKINEKELNI